MDRQRDSRKDSPSAWWGRPSHSAKFQRFGDEKRKDSTTTTRSISPAKASPASIRYSPVSPTIPEEGSRVLLSEHTVTVKSSATKIETTVRTNRYSSKAAANPEAVAAKSRALHTPKSSAKTAMKRSSPAKTSSLISERETTESHSGESLASENEHTSARTKTETTASLRTTAKSGDALRLNDVKASSDNKVRVAYEAAKELKQKLASKDGDTSTSKKYIMATIQTKAPGPAPLPEPGPELAVPDQGVLPGKDPPPLSHSNDEVENARIVFEGMLDNLSRAKESIHCATRQALDCAKLNLADQVIDIIAKRLEMEQSFSRRIDLFFLVDSITVASHNLKATPAVAYRHIVHNALPRLLSAAAPPGSFARENRRQCLKVFKLWHERNIFPPSVIRHFMREIELHNCDRVLMNMSRRPARNERPVDDPIREIEGMEVDEYGSNASFTLPGVSIPHVLDGEEDPNAAAEANANEDYAAAAAPQERHRRVLEDVDGELEMEDVSPETDTWQRQYVSPASILTGPPLPGCPPPSPPPLPSSPPPSTPPPPPPSSPPPPPDAAPYPDSFSPSYHSRQQQQQQQQHHQQYNGEAYDHYHPGVYGEEGYPVPVDNGYNSYAGYPDVTQGPVSPQYGGQHQHHYPYPVDGHSYQGGEYPYQPYAETWSEPSPRSRYHSAAAAPDDHYYNSHHDGYGDQGAEYYHQNGHYGHGHHDGGYASSHGRYSSGYASPGQDHQGHGGHGSSGRSSRRHGHYSHDAGGYSHDYDGGYSRSHSREGGRGGGYSHAGSHSSHDGGGGGGGSGGGGGGGYSSHHQDGYSSHSGSYPNW